MLSRYFKVPHLSIGAMLREHISRETPLGIQAKSYVDAGDLVPDELLLGMLEETLTSEKGGFILDGYPRSLKQAETLGTLLSELNQDLTAVVYLEVPKEVVVDRLLARGREDDTRQVIEKRLGIYNSTTKPVLESYAKGGILKEIQGVGTVEEVHRRILSALGEQ
jgi:adenylate kinase